MLREEKGKGGETKILPRTTGPLGVALEEEFPEVENSVSIWGPDSGVWIGHGQRGFKQLLCATEQSFFEVFDFPMVQGDPQTVLREPYTILITEHAAERMFGSENPIGKIVDVGSKQFGGVYEITGIIKIPAQSSISFDFLTTTVVAKNGSSAPQTWTEWRGMETWRAFTTYFLLGQGSDPKSLEAKLPNFIERHQGREVGNSNRYYIQPLSQQYLHSLADYEIEVGELRIEILYGDMNRVVLFACIAILILLVACINFINLTTARASRRSREIGMRKVLGAHRYQLIYQFLGESTVVAFAALILAIAMTAFVFPFFEAFAHREFSLLRLVEGTGLGWLAGIVVVVGFFAGSYPAFLLSGFQPVRVLKNFSSPTSQARWIRQALVIIQFSISTILVIGTAIVYQQLEYLRHKKLGFSSSLLVSMPFFRVDRQTATQDNWLVYKHQSVKQAFLTHPNVLSAGASRWPVGEYGGSQTPVIPEGSTESIWNMVVQRIDEGFIGTLGIQLVAGRNFSPNLSNEEGKSCLINETAAKVLGWQDPIGKELVWSSNESGTGTVIGVVEDYHYEPLRTSIRPQILAPTQWLLMDLIVRVGGEQVPETLAFLEETMGFLYP